MKANGPKFPSGTDTEAGHDVAMATTLGEPAPAWRVQTAAEEIANGLTHGVGALFAVVGGGVLAWRALEGGDGYRLVSVAVYIVTLVALYVASTVYHLVRGDRIKPICRRIDRMAIYVFIAGCYTPFTLVPLRGTWGFSLLAVIWGLAVVGIALEAWLRNRFLVWSTALYLGMGWLAVFIVWPLLSLVDTTLVAWLVGGGVAYSVGVVFFWWTRLPFHHAIWHLFVLAGSVCHYQAIERVIAP